MTEWAPCPGFPDYEVSSSGDVRRIVMVRGRTPSIIAPFVDRGYLAVKLRRDGVSVKAYVHRLVALAFRGLDPALEVDHRNHDRADLAQIRPATRAQNARNARGWAEHSSQYKGVSWCADRRTWFACIYLDGKTKGLGRYASEHEAARAYNRAARAAWGVFAFLNEVGKYEEAAE